MITDDFTAIPRGQYACILADPPWRFRVWSPKGLGRSADRHYPTLTMADIKAFPVEMIAAENAFLFLWVTGPFLSIGAHIDVMQAWGFAPSGMGFVWAKLCKDQQAEIFLHTTTSFFMGTGYNTRHNAEFCIIGRRGAPVRKSKGIRELIVAPVSDHSRKPVETHLRIEQFCDGPRIELFARNRPHTALAHEWDLFGNQVRTGEDDQAERRSAL